MPERFMLCRWQLPALTRSGRRHHPRARERPHKGSYVQYWNSTHFVICIGKWLVLVVLSYECEYVPICVCYRFVEFDGVRYEYTNTLEDTILSSGAVARAHRKHTTIRATKRTLSG